MDGWMDACQVVNTLSCTENTERKVNFHSIFVYVCGIAMPCVFFI